MSRSEGAFLASAVGDALGWPQENRSSRVGGNSGASPRLELTTWRRREGGRYAPHEHVIGAGTYSDDTQLVLAVARCLERGGSWWDQWTTVELPFWLVYERGGGGATRRAARSWADGKPPWIEPVKGVRGPGYFEAGGNGVAMRVLPHALVGVNDSDFRRIARRVFADGISTHGHPRALVGALAFAYALWRILRRDGRLSYGAIPDFLGEDVAAWAEIPDPGEWAPEWRERAELEHGDFGRRWAFVVDEMLGLLDVARQGLRQGSLSLERRVLDELGSFGPSGGAGTVTAAASIYLASRYASQPPHGLIAAAFAKGADTDTIAAMTGALLGATAGADWLSRLGDKVQDGPYLREMSQRVLRVRPNDEFPDGAWRSGDRRRLNGYLRTLEKDGRVHLPVFGDCRVVDVVDHETRSANVIRTWQLAAEIGQTLAVTTISKIPPSNAQTDVDPGTDEPVASSSARRETVAVASDEMAGVPRLGVIFEVADIERSASFFERAVGLRVVRRTDDYVSFGALALESSGRQRMPLVTAELPELDSGEASLTIFVDELDRAYEAMRRESAGTIRVGQRRGRRAFRCLDPDAHILEFRERTSSTDRSDQQAGGRDTRPRDDRVSDRHVVPNASGGWDVVKSNARRASAHALTKEEAIERGREIVRNAGGGELAVYSHGGQVIERQHVSGENGKTPSD